VISSADKAASFEAVEISIIESILWSVFRSEDENSYNEWGLVQWKRDMALIKMYFKTYLRYCARIDHRDICVCCKIRKFCVPCKKIPCVFCIRAFYYFLNFS